MRLLFGGVGRIITRAEGVRPIAKKKKTLDDLLENIAAENAAWRTVGKNSNLIGRAK